MLTRWWWCFLWGWFWVFSRSNFISTFFMFFSHFYSLCSPCSFPILSVFFPLCFFVGLFQFYFHSLLLWCIVLSPEMTVGWGSMFARCRWCFCYMGSSRISPFCFTCSDGLDEVRAQSSGVVVFFPDLSLHIYNYIYIHLLLAFVGFLYPVLRSKRRCSDLFILFFGLLSGCSDWKQDG